MTGFEVEFAARSGGRMGSIRPFLPFYFPEACHPRTSVLFRIESVVRDLQKHFTLRIGSPAQAVVGMEPVQPATVCAQAVLSPDLQCGRSKAYEASTQFVVAS